MNALFAKLMHSRTALAQFARYVIVGLTVFCIDVGSFQWMVESRTFLWVAVIVSYALGVVVHFSLNKYWNFRDYERTFVQQARTYLLITAAQLLTTLAIVEAGVHLVRLSPLEAKILAVFINVPFFFFAHKFMTFGPGIRNRLRGVHR
jgi:putative flippase GtrA